MKKTIGLALAALLCVSSGFAIEGEKLPIVSEQKEMGRYQLGKDAIAQIRKDYQEGRYDSFLKEMNASYEQVSESKSLVGLSELRGGGAPNLKWLQEVKGLQKEKNAQLLQSVAGQDSLFAEKVRSVASVSSSDSQEAAQSVLSAIHQKIPGSGATKDENQLIDLDLEYEYKALHLDMPSTKSEISSEAKGKLYALKMEQMDKMLLASQSFEDASLKQAVETFSQNLDNRLAQSWDLSDLQSLARGQTKPADKTEGKVVSILKNHQEKMGDLARNYLP